MNNTKIASAADVNEAFTISTGKERKILKHTNFLLRLLILLGMCLLAQQLRAQDTVNGGFSGVVYGVNGAPLAGAVVTFTNLDNGVPVSTRTDNNGRFVRNALLPGNYRVEITIAGYKTERVEQILLATRTNVVLPPFNLKPEDNVAGVTSPTPQTPTVAVPTATPPAQPVAAVTRQNGETDEDRGLILETRRSEAFTEKEVTMLPLGGTTLARSFDELSLLAPGVLPAPQAIGNSVGPGVGPGVGTSGQFSVNGLRSRANNFTVDGSDNNDDDIGVRRQGFFSLIPQPIESVQEYQVITLLAPAQYGRNFGAQVNALSRSGGNRFNGTLYGFFNSNRLNARNYFDSVGTNTRIPLQGRRKNGNFVNVELNNAGTASQVFVENNSGDEDSLTFLQGGGVLGGHIIRNKMFFFISAEGQILNASKEAHFAVPTVEQRGFLGAGAEGISIPSEKIESFPTTVTGDLILGLFPFPNNPTGLYGRNTYTRVLPADARGKILSGKYDYNFNIGGRKQFFTARYNFTDDRRDLQQVGGAIFSSVRPLTQTNNFSAFVTGEVTDKVSNVLRFSWGRTRLRFEEIPYTESYLRPTTRTFTNPAEGRFLLRSLGLVNQTLPNNPRVSYFQVASTIETVLGGPVGQVNIAGFSPLGVDVFNFPQRRVNNTFQFADTMFFKAGNHNPVVGTDIRHVILDSELPRNSRLAISSTGAFRANNYSGPLALPNIISPIDVIAAGFATNVFQTLVSPNSDSSIELSSNQLNFFAQDEYRVSRNLTLTYGLRYELNTVPEEADRKIESTFGQTLLPALNQFLAGRSKIYDLDSNNLAPRVGFAYAPSRTTVVRGGYGLYYDQILGAVVSQSRNVFPTFLTLNFGGVPEVVFNGQSTIRTPYNTTINGIPLIQPGTLNTLNPALSAQQVSGFIAQFQNQLGATIPQKDLDTPLAHQYSVGLEQEIFGKTVLSIAYVGTTGRNLLRFASPNLGRNNIVNVTNLTFIGAQPNFQGTNRVPNRPVANVGPIEQFETTGRSQYHSLQVQLRGRLKLFNQGLQYQVNYNYSKAMDDVSDVFDLAGSSSLPQNSLNLAGEYAPANFDVRHRIAYSFIYDLPSLDERSGFVKYVLGGWQIIGTGRFNTGQPFTVNSIYDVNQDGILTDRLNNTQFIAQGNSRRQPLVLTGSNPANLLTMLAPVGQNGAVGRNSFRAGNVLDLDLALNKSFPINERQSLLLRLEAFNFINRANFGVPVRFLEAPNFGQAVETITPGRRIQVALKYIF